MLLVDIALVTALGSASALQAPQVSEPRAEAAVAVARRVDAAPVIDGRGDDAIWRLAPRTSDFRQFEPRVGVDPSFRTEFQATYDDANLYVFVRAYDPHPDSIMRALTRRDVRGPSDQITLWIDSQDDRRSGFEFNVNPDGVKRDYAVYNDGNEDESWNGIWDVAATVDSLGWTAEFRIPMSQLRYSDAPRHRFGFGVWRDIERYKERVAWPEFDRTRPGLISQLGWLDGLEGIRSPRSLEVTPYTVTRNVTRESAGGGFERAQTLSVGGDLKFGVTPNVTLDATVNPDFGQVEADPAVLNLTALETFLAERRPFFVEGTGFYRFGLNCYIVVDCDTREGLFYSRRIGRAPTLLNDYGTPATPAATPIAAAVKLTGRTGNFSFGVLDAVTRQVEGLAHRTIEPRTNYAVLRAQQDLRTGDAGVSWIATAVNRSLDDNTRAVLHSSAFVTGLSFRNRFGSRNYELSASLVASRVTGSHDVIRRTQQSAVHYFQQPDDDLTLDANRTSLSGHAQHVKVGKYSGGITRFETSLVRQSPGFEVNDLGFLRRADILDWSTWGALNFLSPRPFYRWLRINGNHWQHWNTSGLRLDNAVNFNAHMGLHNNWDLHAGGTFGGLGESFCDRCTRGGPALRRSSGFFPWFGVNGDNRRTIVPSLWVNLRFTDEGRTTATSFSPRFTMRFSTRTQLAIGAGISNDHNNTQWYGNFTDAAGITHYTFADLDQRTLSFNARLNYTASPDLTFEFYGEPFISRGTFSDIREIGQTPRATDYDDRFLPYTPPPGSPAEFRFSQLRTNAVVRWEYRPGSTLFLVWAHGRQDYRNEVDAQPWHNDYRDLFDLHPDNTFLIKVAYWLNR
jgi:hypothetical protein